jgi:hypothetical protein
LFQDADNPLDTFVIFASLCGHCVEVAECQEIEEAPSAFLMIETAMRIATEQWSEIIDNMIFRIFSKTGKRGGLYFSTWKSRVRNVDIWIVASGNKRICFC